ncbi:MAG: response regulator [Candidatus Hydrogenedentota bacterium]|nr:MAG: response regulator [Candidatus Hydrogenedentota bacterium]
MLLDLNLPKYSGHEVLEKIKDEPVLRRIPAVMPSSSAESGDIDGACDFGANSYLIKPTRFYALIKIAREIHLCRLVHNQLPTPNA